MSTVLQRYAVKDVIFLAVTAAALTVAGMITMPLVMTVTLFGVRNMAASIFYGAFIAIGLMKVSKPGALFLIAFFNGAVLLMMSPVIPITVIWPMPIRPTLSTSRNTSALG